MNYATRRIEGVEYIVIFCKTLEERTKALETPYFYKAEKMDNGVFQYLFHKK